MDDQESASSSEVSEVLNTTTEMAPAQIEVVQQVQDRIEENEKENEKANRQESPDPPPKKSDAVFVRGEQILYLIEKMRGPDADPMLVDAILCSDPICDEYLEFVARTGRPIFEWSVLKSLLISKLESVLWEMSQAGPYDHLASVPNTDRSSSRQYIDRILSATRSLAGVPFTIQRICELLVLPKKHYKRADRFYRALEKNINVVTTVDGDGRRETERQPGPDQEDEVGMRETSQNRFTPEKTTYNHTQQ